MKLFILKRELGISLNVSYYLICRKAIEEIIRDTKRGAIRAEVGGAYGWKSAPKVNPHLFGNTLMQVIQTNTKQVGDRHFG